MRMTRMMEPTIQQLERTMATKNKDFGKFSNFRRMFFQRILVDGSEERKEGDREKDAFFFFTRPMRRNRNTD